VLVLLVLSAATPASGQPPPVERDAGGTSLPAAAGQRLDAGHDALYRWVNETLASFDRRFADPGEDPMAMPSNPFRIGFSVEAINRDGSVDLDLDTYFQISVRLPNLEKRLRVILTNEALSETAIDDEAATLRAGVRVDLPKAFDFDVGVKLNAPPVAFASLRWSGSARAGSWDVYPFAKLFAETEDGPGASAALTVDRWTGTRLFRSATSTRWLDELDQTEWAQQFVLARVDSRIEPERYSSRVRGEDFGRAFGLRLEAGGARTAGADYYEAGVFWKWPFWSDWLYIGVLPFVVWESERRWQADVGIRFGFDALFRDVSRASSPPPRLPAD
jgi:hypothetical protein